MKINRVLKGKWTLEKVEDVLGLTFEGYYCMKDTGKLVEVFADRVGGVSVRSIWETRIRFSSRDALDYELTPLEVLALAAEAP